MKYGPFYKKIISAVLAFTVAVGCGFSSALADGATGVTANQSVALVNWNDRTYDVDLNVTAPSNIQTETTPSDIFLVLDESGSMGSTSTTYKKVTGTLSTSVTYFALVSGQYQQLSYVNAYGYNGWYYGSSPRVFVKNSATAGVTYVSVTPGNVPSNNTEGPRYTYMIFKADTNNDGVINTSDTPTEVTYHTTGVMGWYDGTTKVTPSAVNTPASNTYIFYAHYTNTQFYQRQTKLEELKSAATAFVESIKNSSPDSRIGVIGFATQAHVLTQKTYNTNYYYSLLRCGNSDSYSLITGAIDGLHASGSTAADYAMHTTYNEFQDSTSYEPVNQTSNRKKIVVFFTDGEPNHGSGFNQTVASSAIYWANQMKLSPLNATIFSIGVFSSSVDYRVDGYMEAIASEDGQGNDYYYKASETLPVDAIFQQIPHEIGGISGATMTYTVDQRFKIVDAAGGTVSGQTITWSSQDVPVNTNGSPGWSKTIRIKAKTEFIGGNSIPVMASSSITYSSGSADFGTSPKVNVKPIFYLGTDETTIFRGENVPDSSLQPYTLNDSNAHVTGQGMYIVPSGTTGSFSYQWSGGGVSGSSQSFPQNVKPLVTTAYKLTATFTSSSPWVLMKDTSGTTFSEPAGGNKANNTDNSGNNYTVHVISGSITIQKTIDGTFGSSDPKRSFVFLVTGTAPSGCATIHPFYVTLTMGSGSTASKTIVGLSKGTYTVKEIDSSWQYDAGTVQLSRTPGTIGFTKNPAGTDYTDKSLTASVTNHHSHNQWFSATDSVTNIINPVTEAR